MANAYESIGGSTTVVNNSLIHNELTNLQGANNQDIDTGDNMENGANISNYSTRLFGAPFQLLNSVDKRFKGVNDNVGFEYLQNFLLNSPIVGIKPGMAHYTGNDTPSWWDPLKQVFNEATLDGDDGFYKSMVEMMTIYSEELGRTLVEKLSMNLTGTNYPRMFGFKNEFSYYTKFMNYMCNSAALLMSLTSSDTMPDGVFMRTGTWYKFSTSLKWENYRMMDNESEVDGVYDNILEIIGDLPDYAENKSEDVTWMQYMVEPTSFSESIANLVGKSAIESAIDGIDNSIGDEIAFYTNSNIDAGVLGTLAGIAGDVTETGLEMISQVVSTVNMSAFTHHLFNGAVASLKGQKMLYPNIYKESNSSMNYDFTIPLSSPYGDIYNIYLNNVVALSSLICLAGPRLASANSLGSPFLVQVFIPGMCTCNLGIVKELSIVKNEKNTHVSATGFPLDIKITLRIEELYNALAISPTTDPSSFLFNDTLNDYLANMSGLYPSYSNYITQHKYTTDMMYNTFTDTESLLDAGFKSVHDWLESYLGLF